MKIILFPIHFGLFHTKYINTYLTLTLECKAVNNLNIQLEMIYLCTTS